MRNLFTALDVMLLLAAQTFIDFCQDWLSLAQRRLERGLIALTLALNLGWVVVSRSSAWWLIGTVFAAAWLLIDHSASNRQRIEKMMSLGSHTYRLTLVLLAVFNFALLFWDRRPGDPLWVCHAVTYALAFYVLAWPSGGDLGGKRKAARQKIVDSFGREYVPEGAGA